MKIAYYIVTGLMAAFMGGSAIPDIIQIKEAQEIMQLLGYPPYLLPFLGVAKVLGVIGVLQPWYPRLREWAYAGLVIDVVGAFYSHISIGDVPSRTAGPVIAIVLILASYILYRRVFTRDLEMGAVR
jgi:DoxX-like family